MTLSSTAATFAKPIVLNGSTSGSVSVAAPAVAGSQAYTLPTAYPGVNGYVLASTTSGTLSWVPNPDVNTTYTYTASSTTGGANLTLTGSDATTNTVKLTNAGHITATYTSATEVTLGSDATDANTAGAIVARDGSGNFSAGGATLGNVTVGVATDQTITTTSGDLILDSASGTIRVIPSQINSRNSTYTPVTIPLTAVTGLNNVAVASSTGGYFPDISVNNYLADTGGGNIGAGVTLRSTSGTSASPTGTANNQIIGSMNFDGYATGTGANWASYLSTVTGGTGGGVSYVYPLHAQGYARQAFTTTTFSVAVTGASGNGTTATLTFALQNVQVFFAGMSVTIAGMTPSGYNGTYTITAATTTSISYANATTGFTSGGTITAPTVNAGTGFRIRGYPNSTPLIGANRINFADFNSAATTFKSNSYTFANEVITGSTLTATNYLTLGATTGSINQDTFTVKNTAGTSTYLTLASGTGSVNQDTFTVKNTAGTSTYLTLNSSGSTFNLTTGTTTINNNLAVKGTGSNTILQTFGDVVFTQTPYSTFSYTYPLRISGKRTDNLNPQDNDSTGYQFQLFGSGSNFVNLGSMSMKYKTSGDNTIDFNLDNNAGGVTTPLTISAAKTTIRAGTSAAVNDIVTVEAAKVSFAAPIKFPTYTIAQAGAITGALGWQISISDSPVAAGRMAYWTTTATAGWRYVDTNLAI